MEISIGQVASVQCAAVASDEHNCLVMLQRRPDESLYQLPVRLDAAIHRAWDSAYFTDEINGED